MQADEADFLDASLFAFGNLENQIDPVVRQIDDFWYDCDVETAATVIDFDDPLNVGLHGGLRQRAAWF